MLVEVGKTVIEATGALEDLGLGTGSTVGGIGAGARETLGRAFEALSEVFVVAVVTE